jgi:hypothetical protein
MILGTGALVLSGRPAWCPEIAEVRPQGSPLESLLQLFTQLIHAVVQLCTLCSL